MYSFPNFKLVCCSMSGSNCCILTSIQVSQEAGEVVWYSHLFQNFPVCCDTVKSFNVVDETEVDILCNSLAFLMIQQMFGNLISGSSAFSKSFLNIWKFGLMYC